jgi:hypothetical protein
MVVAELNFPPLPEDIKKYFIDYVNEYIKTWSPYSNEKNYELYPNETVNIVNRKITDWLPSKEMYDRFQEICPLCFDITVFIMLNSTDTPAMLSAHTDYNRDSAILYVLEAGGPEVETVFYEKAGKVELNNLGQIRPQYFNEKNLKKIDSKILKEDTWAGFSGQTPHGVYNILNRRIVLSMASRLSLEDIVKKYPQYIKK